MEPTERKRDPSGFLLLAFFGLAFFGWLVFNLADPVRRQELVQSVLDCLMGTGMCLGLVVLASAGAMLWNRLFAAKPHPGLYHLSRRYATRCYAVEMPETGSAQGEAGLASPASQGTSYAVYLLVSHMNHGIGLEALPPPDSWKWGGAGNADRFRQLNSSGSSLILVPLCRFSLYYVLYHRQGNLKLEMAPTNQPGYTGHLPVLLRGRQVEVVMVYASIVKPGNLTETIALERPIKLKLVAVDGDGRDDPRATRALYSELLGAQEPEEDDSWMYRSRPSFGLWY